MPSPPSSLTKKDKKKLGKMMRKSLGAHKDANMNTMIAIVESTKGNPFASMGAKNRPTIPESKVLSFILGNNSSRTKEGVKKASVYNVIQNVYKKNVEKLKTKKAKNAQMNQEFRNLMASFAKNTAKTGGSRTKTRKARRSA